MGELLNYKVDEYSEIHYLLNQEICVSSKLCEELEDSNSIKNLQEREFNQVEELDTYIAKEINKHAKR